MAHLIPLFVMSLAILIIIGVGFYLKQYIHEKLALAFVVVFSGIVAIEMLPGALKAAFLGAIENAKNNNFPF